MATSRASRNVDVVRTAYEAFNRGDIEGVLETLGEDIEWIEPEGSHYRGIHRGHDAVVRGVFAQNAEDVDGFEAGIDRIIEDGDSVVTIGTTSGTFRSSGRQFEIPFAHVLEMQDGHVVRFQNYTDTYTWHEAAAE